jgi:1,4-alpha-glucan branching enzyme
LSRKKSAEKSGHRESVGRGPKPIHRVELKRFLSYEHPDPHSILGAHMDAGGTVIRAFRPEAESMTLIEEGGFPVQMERIHKHGLFQLWLEGRSLPISYRLGVQYPNGQDYEFYDPYGHLPTLGELDIHLSQEGRHELVYEKLGAHRRQVNGIEGVAFAVWAPNAVGVSVVGDFNSWDGRLHQMRVLGSSGIWEIFLPDIPLGSHYKIEIRTRGGHRILRADPYALWAEVPPKTASIVHESDFKFWDKQWMEERAQSEPYRKPLSIYELQLGSWRRSGPHGEETLGYRELAKPLAEYVRDLGFTHVELMPVMEHPFGGSWGYQVTGYYAPTSRHGTPDDLRFLIDHLHRNGIGVILDWVPAHFPRDDFALGRFDGTPLYEHADPRQGEHPDWGTFVFNYGRNEVRNFLIANAVYWLSEFHVDGLRLDAVASMLYLDYSREEGEWIPNQYGGRENLDAIAFLRGLNEVVHNRFPGVMMIAEESTAWPAVSRPTYTGGLGFGFKWNMGWMHDTLVYFTKEPVHRRYHHNQLTFSLIYAFHENFILPLSHDEVVHGKRSMLDKMPGDRWQKFANLRALYGYMWAHPGKKLLFMGSEFGQWSEWDHNRSLDWHLLEEDDHRGLQNLVRELNRVYRDKPALWREDFDAAGFQWIDSSNGDENALAFLRKDPETGRELICICNLSPVVRKRYRVGLPRPGKYREVLNTDSENYGGSNAGNGGVVRATGRAWHGQPHSATLVLPPLATLWLEAESE